MGYESPAVQVYGYPTQLTPQEVLSMDMAPTLAAIQNRTKQQADVNAMLLDSALAQRLQERKMAGAAQIQQMRDKMLYDRLQGMEKMKIDAIRQQGMNKQIQDALNNAQDMGVTPPARQPGMDDQAYLDSINHANGQARDTDIKASSAVVTNSMIKLQQLAEQKNQLEASVLPDAQKVALAKIGSLQQWVQQQGDPDLMASYQNAAKNNLPVPQDVAQAYQTYAAGVFEATKYDLLTKAGKQKQYDAIKAESDLQNQLIHNVLYAPDRSGRMAQKPYNSQIINDATTQYEQKFKQASDDAAAQAAKSGHPDDAAAATQAELASKQAAITASAIRQRASVDTQSLAQKAGSASSAIGDFVAKNYITDPLSAIAKNYSAFGSPNGPSNMWTDNLGNTLKTSIFGQPGAAAPTPQDILAARLANPALAARVPMIRPPVRVVAPTVQTNMPAITPVNILQNPQLQQAFQAAQPAPMTAAPMTPGSMGIGGLQDISPTDMVNAARYAQMLNTTPEQ